MKRLALCAALAACGFDAPAAAPDGSEGTPDGAPDSGPSAGTWRTITGGTYHSCGIRTDDSLWCWGDNGEHQLGTSTPAIDVGAPVHVGSARWKQVSIGVGTTCAIQMNDTLWCWGGSNGGVTATDPAAGDVTEPQQVGTATVTTVSVGISHACAIRTGGELACWGNNGTGAFGDGTTTSSFVPVPIPGIWTAVTTGAGLTCALADDRSLWCWGLNTVGQVGIGAASDQPTLAPTLVAQGPFERVSAYWATACALRGDGHVLCWGYGSYGNLGTNKTMAEPAPVETTLDDDQWRAVALGAFHACGLRADGELWCWGDNTYGELGTPPAGVMVNPNPARTGATLGPIASLGDHLGFSHSCLITRDGKAGCGGYNGTGGLGSGEGGSVLSPTQVPGVWLEVSAGSTSACATPETGNVQCWGRNDTGEYGAGDTVPMDVPRATLFDQPIGIGAGAAFTCVVKANHDVHCAGYNREHQLGDASGNKSTPVKVNGVGVRSVVARGHACALPELATTDGIACWGPNGAGQLGVGNADPQTAPRVVLNAHPVISVAVGNAHTCGVYDDNTLFCTGSNGTGQLGDGSLNSRSTFAQVLGGYTNVYGGGDHTCALDLASRLLCWGQNGEGQLGIGSTAMATTPQPVGTDIWKTVGLGITHSCAIRSDNTLWCWGRNARGELGDGTTMGRTAPTQVGSDSDWVSVTAGQEFTCARKLNNSLWCWGLNAYGETGNDHAWRADWLPIE